jgi:hypothetical protein
VTPDVERYGHAQHQVREVRDELRTFERLARIDQWEIGWIPDLKDRVNALDTWWRWANGDSIRTERLAEVVDILVDAGGDHAGRYRLLGQAIEQFCRDAGTHLPSLEPEPPAVAPNGLEPAGIDIDL